MYAMASAAVAACINNSQVGSGAAQHCAAGFMQHDQCWSPRPHRHAVCQMTTLFVSMAVRAVTNSQMTTGCSLSLHILVHTGQSARRAARTWRQDKLLLLILGAITPESGPAPHYHCIMPAQLSSFPVDVSEPLIKIFFWKFSL